MGDLQTIARERVDADLNRRLLDLPTEINALQQQLAAKGSLKSGNMLKGVLKLAQESLRSQGAAITAHYAWAVQESITASQSWVRSLAEEGANSLAPLLARASSSITEACRLADQPNLASRLVSDLEITHLEVRNRIKTDLDAAFASKSRGTLRKAASVLAKVVKGTSGSST